MVEIHFRIQGLKEFKPLRKITAEDKNLAVSILAREVDAFAQACLSDFLLYGWR